MEGGCGGGCSPASSSSHLGVRPGGHGSPLWGPRLPEVGRVLPAPLPTPAAPLSSQRPSRGQRWGNDEDFLPWGGAKPTAKAPRSTSKPAAPPGELFPCGPQRRKLRLGAHPRLSQTNPQPETGTWCHQGSQVHLLSSLPPTPVGPPPERHLWVRCSRVGRTCVFPNCTWHGPQQCPPKKPT